MSTKIFISYAHEDQDLVRQLYDDLEAVGFEPWMDDMELLPGMDWEYEIRQALENADFFIPCLSRASLKKVGYFQKELRMGRSQADLYPQGRIYMIPVRLENVSDLPHDLGSIQWADYPKDRNQIIRAINFTLQRYDQPESSPTPPPEAPRETAGEVPQNVARIDTGGGSYFGGNISVQGDFVGRDKIVNHDQGKEILMNEHFRHRNKLFDALREHFGTADIKEIAYKLRNSISYDNLSGMTLNEKMISLIEYSENTRQYRDLVEMVIMERPFLRDELTPIVE
jgi:hypothetical protein